MINREYERFKSAEIDDEYVNDFYLNHNLELEKKQFKRFQKYKIRFDFSQLN
jgi:hypothetical protein